MKHLSWAALPLCVGVVTGCAPGGASETGEESTTSADQPEVWARNDDPWIFSKNMERHAAALPRSGEVAPVPWAGSYWPTWQDSINFRWDGPESDSAAKKYELAMGVTGVEDAVSRKLGVDSYPETASCTTQSQCAAGEMCALRQGASSGRCIPRWVGVCHGWAAAAMLFPAPRNPVVANGVTFKVQDLRALASLVHDTTWSLFLSTRCDADDSREGNLTYDEHGRPMKACRDTNAGTFHVVLGNFVGVHRQPFIEDRVFDQQVWNHPVRGYTVLAERAVTGRQANRLITGLPPDDAGSAGEGEGDAGAGEKYLFNDLATSLTYLKTRVSYITEAASASDGELSPALYTRSDTYEYILELDADGAVIGGEWVGASRRNHPDFLWLPLRAGATTVAEGKISVAVVEALVKESVATRVAAP